VHARKEHPEYYDWCRRTPYDASRSCSYEEWMKGTDEADHVYHPKGFPVFLRPAEIARLDEYRDGDPYTVQENMGSAFHRHRIETTLDLARRAVGRISTPPRILDVACGQGHITAEIQRSFGDAAVSALDCSVSAISFAAEHFPGIDFVVANAYRPPYPPASFDLAVCNNIWEHVPDPLTLLAGIARVLKTGGRIIISTPSRYKLSNLLRVSLGKRVAFQSPQHVTEYTVGQVVEQLRYGRFAVEEIRGRKIRRERTGVKGWVLDSLVGPVLETYLCLVGSHHSLAQTVFYLAKKEENQENE
jgi:2-polyprenyl-3-methyl-5-hydroxy-6-metoxy-1,4-benzoquinol methylase